jgi:hypothetical protein
MCCAVPARWSSLLHVQLLLSQDLGAATVCTRVWHLLVAATMMICEPHGWGAEKAGVLVCHILR